MNKKKLKIIKDIEKSVPQEWRDALITEQYVAPDVRADVIAELEAREETLEALQGEEKLQMEKHLNRLKNIFDTGYFDLKEKVVDQEMAKKIEDHVSAGIEQAIKDGLLSDADPDFKKLTKKAKRNVNRNTQSNLRTAKAN